MSELKNFRSAFRGFNRQDVVNYIEYINNTHNAQLEQLNNQLQAALARPSDEEMKALDGETVTMRGYMGLYSPLDGAEIYLMDLPYQSCPYCMQTDTSLVNTMTVVAPEGTKFAFTEMPIEVVGKVKYEEGYVDEAGYSYNYRIVDATVKEIEAEALPENVQMYAEVIGTGLVTEVVALYDEAYMMCFYKDCELNPETLAPIEIGVLDMVISKVDKVDPEDKSEIYAVLADTKELFQELNQLLENKDYEMLSSKEVTDKAQACYNAFDAWMKTPPAMKAGNR